MADRTSGGDGRSVRSETWDLLPGYALGALDDLERRSVERLLESDAAARRALDEYREVLASFTVEAEPPAGLRAEVLERVRSTPQSAGTTDARTGTERGSGVSAPGAVAPVPSRGPGPDEADGVVDLATRRRRRHWGVAVAAVAATVAVVVPTTIAVQVTAERDRLREQNSIVSEMLVDPDASILRGRVEGGGEASALVADGDMLFRADGLPEPGEGKAYQLWVVAEDGSVSSAGVLGLSGGETTSLVRGVDGVGLAVSVEPEGGSQQPTTDPIVVLST